MVLSVVQTIWCIIFGLWAYEQYISARLGVRDCFMQLGLFTVCVDSCFLSVYTNLFLLMAQALVSRILVPGKSNFVTSSVLHPYT